MGQYTVKHQSDRSCLSCAHYDWEITRDSFGEMIQEYCDKDHYNHVGRYSGPCKDFKRKTTKENK